MSDEIYRVELTADERATVVFALGAYLGCMVRDRALTDDRLHRMLTIANKFGCS